VTRLRAAAARLRPSSRKGAAGLALAGVAIAAVLVVAVVGLVLVLPAVYDEYGYHPEKSALSWAALTPQYADSALCQRCHQREYLPWQAGKHAPVSCESCHGPLAEHAATAPVDAPAGTIAIAKPSDGLCALCHATVAGRPLAFPQVDLTQHYAGAPCLSCHDSHSTVPLRPPQIPHSLDKLPACTTCHKPAGLKPVPVGHVEAPDAVCLTCHQRPAAGDRTVP
jgi:hypothetical protein